MGMEKSLAKVFLFAPSFVLSLVLVTGCAGLSHLSTPASYEREVARETVFLPRGGRYGERDRLRAGEPLDIVKLGWGYSLVRTSTGRVGEVPTEDIGPRTPKPAVARSGDWRTASFDSPNGGAPTPFRSPHQGRLQTPPSRTPDAELSEEIASWDPVEPELPAW